MDFNTDSFVNQALSHKFSHSRQVNIWLLFAFFQLSCYFALIIHLYLSNSIFEGTDYDSWKLLYHSLILY